MCADIYINDCKVANEAVYSASFATFFYSLGSSNLWFYGYVSTTKYLHFGIAKNTKL